MWKDYWIAISLAMLWGIVRNIFAGEIKWKEFIRTTIWSWLIWLLAFWLAPYLHDDQHVRYSIIYVSWMLAPHIVRILITKLPWVIETYVGKKSA